MYFKSRAEAGRKLAKELAAYSRKNVIVIALNEGGVIVGAQIAMAIHANLALMLSENIYLPGEHDAIGALSSTGNFAYNDMFSTGQIDELAAEFHSYIEQQRIEKMHHLNILVGKDGEIHKEYLRRHVVILVSDGLPSGFALRVAADYLKTVAIQRLIVATPIASVTAVDSMHLVADEIQCLSTIPNYMGTDHYYDDNTIPKTEDLYRIIKNISLHWQR